MQINSNYLKLQKHKSFQEQQHSPQESQYRSSAALLVQQVIKSSALSSVGLKGAIDKLAGLVKDGNLMLMRESMGELLAHMDVQSQDTLGLSKLSGVIFCQTKDVIISEAIQLEDAEACNGANVTIYNGKISATSANTIVTAASNKATATAAAKGSKAYATADEASAVASIAGAEAYATEYGAVANATAAGAIASATVEGAGAIANQAGARANATASGAYADAVKYGAEAYASASDAAAFSSVMGARAYAMVAGATSNAQALMALSYASVAGAMANAAAVGARAYATVPGAYADACAVEAEAYATVVGAVANASVSGAIANATAAGAIANATVVGAIANATTAGAIAHAVDGAFISMPVSEEVDATILDELATLKDDLIAQEPYGSKYNNSESKELIDNFIKRINIGDKYLVSYTRNSLEEVNIQTPPAATIGTITFTILLNDFFASPGFLGMDIESLKQKYLNKEWSLDDLDENDPGDNAVREALETAGVTVAEFGTNDVSNPLFATALPLDEPSQHAYTTLTALINQKVSEIPTGVIQLINAGNQEISLSRIDNLAMNITGVANLGDDSIYDGKLMVHDRAYDRKQMLLLLSGIKSKNEELFSNAMANIIAGLPKSLGEQRMGFKDTFTTLYVSGQFPSEGVKLTYLHFLLRCGHLH